MAAALTFPAKLNLARLATPLVPLSRLSKRYGGPTIWCKRDDLTGCIESGNKVRKLEYALAEALRLGCDTVISCGGTQSNHARATAALCAQLGLHCHLILREDTDPSSYNGNLLLDHVLGATIDTYPRKTYGATLDNLLHQAWEHYAALGRNAYVIPTGASDGVGLWGYLEAARELRDDFKRHDINPGAIICASGSGGTQGGLTLGCHMFDVSAQVIGVAVCDNAAYFEQKVRADWHHWALQYDQPEVPTIAVHTLDAYIGAGYGLASDEVFQTIALVAQQEGLILDPTYTGKAFHGLLKELEAGRFKGLSDIVFVHTGGIYGLLAQQQQLETWFTRHR